MTRSLSRFQAIVLGTFVLAGVGLGALGLFWIGGKSTAGVPPFLARWLLPDTLTLRAGFARIQGVEKGTRVRVKGVEAGEVVDIERPREPSGEVVLVMRLDGKMKGFVRRDAAAQIMAEGMVGGKVVEIEPGTDREPPAEDGAVITARSSSDVSDILARMDQTVQDLRDARGSLYKLVHDDELHAEMVDAIRKAKGTLSSLQQNADAMKEMPIVRAYVRDMRRELVRPECERNRMIFAETDLFEAGGAILTSDGKAKLDGIAPWLEGLKHKGSEVVVAAYTAKGGDNENARTLTQKQSEAVSTYLVDKHSIQKMGWFSWSRKVTALGCGSEPPPLTEKKKLPDSRIEVIVFVPH
jgi:outer membrane protein OmpA-like peptidoglycan-associated protein